MVEDGFSKEEIDLMGDSELLLTKRKVISKMADRFSAVEGKFRQIMLSESSLHLPPDTLVKAGKVSRGENYKGLPYIVLDYPRLMTRHDVLNIRLLFWWGHYFTLSLHVAGGFWQERKPNILKNIGALTFGKIRFQVDGSPWENDIFSGNFHDLNPSDSVQTLSIEKSTFLRLSYYLPLHEIPNLDEFATKGFKKFMSILKD
ncbi:hypothetical protein [uncultured Imperialibacter sp.]|uniref:hypothetical protein n=1 Tax=uncultured Imperialibacter sp. TaxID=1672639 RepID=UPI0030DCF7C4|tara:strand:+ start:12311 stop:12916 length:606 start_codon:yes stop_codon:yes gene_type:complete